MSSLKSYGVEMRKTILVDIDHTISNSFWRDSMMGNRDWDAYHSASVDDKPIPDTIDMLCALQVQGYKIIGITARPEKWRDLTMKWLIRHLVCMDELLMRPDDSFRPAPEIKMELVAKRFGDNLCEEVAFIMDDRDDIATAFKGCGITVLQVHARHT